MVKASRSRDDCQCKDGLLLTVPKRGHATQQGATGGSTGIDQEAEGVRGKCGQEPLL